MRTRLVAGIAPVLALSLSACALFGIDPQRVGLQETTEAQRPVTGIVETPAAKPAKPAVAEHRPAAPKPAGACLNDAACMAQLKSMVANPDRSWVGRPETSQSFASGTRLFAYRALREQLTCRELAAAIADVKTATARLVQPASGVPTAQLQKVALLASDVAAELGSEQASRCAAGTGVLDAREKLVRSQ